MKIPTRLANLLAPNAALVGAINLTLHDFLVWFEDRSMVFFPEYTDHGPKHIEEVFATAESLIKEESWAYLSAEDAAALALSVVLHDCAMHLSEDGFIVLVNPVSSRAIVPGFSEKPWPELWADFLSEASRFDARKLKSLFGDTEPVRRPPLDAQAMTRRDRLLIGEFLRRHHPRLAHEIALWGVPGPSEDKIELIKVPQGLKSLSGFIARSHGLSLRESVETLPRIHRRQSYNVHVTFIMAVLRVADYLQIQSERAPKQVLNIRSLRSPVSQGEWKAHDAVEYLDSTDDDPEAIVVFAKPKTVKTFLRLEVLLAGLQRELDESWAVLREVYGLLPGLQNLGLKIRRVKSNLDDKQEFSKTVSYYPDRIIFEADPEILKLLIEPLYGADGGIAVRELVQNAVDACRELRDYLRDTSSESLANGAPRGVDVSVHLEVNENGGWLTVKDRGIGMTSDVIKNYFLKAGASFRRSDAWKEQHETPDGEPRVLRSGRFGIGVLAAFLLGDRVEVSSRHVSQPPDQGIQFSASIDDEAIELQKVTLPDVGTTIRARLSKTTAAKFKRRHSSPWDRKWDWDWYFLRDPYVERKVTVTESLSHPSLSDTLEHENFIPAPNSTLPDSWHRISHEDFQDIHWHFRENRADFLEEGFFCNGIRVGNYRPVIEKKLAWTLSVQTPVISVFDASGKLPLNLQRSNLTRELSFEPELLEDIYRDVISYLLAQTPTVPPHDTKSLKTYEKLSYPGITGYDWFWSTPEGLSLASQWFVRRVSPPNLYLVPELMSMPFQIPSELSYIASFGIRTSGVSYYDPWVRFALTGTGLRSPWLEGVKAKGRRILISTKYEKRLKERKFIPKTFLASIKEEWRTPDWVVLSTLDCPSPTVPFREFTLQTEAGLFTMLAEWYPEATNDKEGEAEDHLFETDWDSEFSYSSEYEWEMKESILVPVWRDIIGESAVVPFDLTKRKKSLAAAFSKLAPYLDSHRPAIRKSRK